MSGSTAAYSQSGHMSSGGRRSVTMPTPPPTQRLSSSDGRRSSTPLGMPRPSSTKERLTPMPDYLHPVTQSASRRFKKIHEDHMMDKLLEKRQAKKDKNQSIREDARKIARKIPLELLAKEWMSDNQATVETRAFLVDKVLPTLILGVEKLLVEVDKRQLSEKEEVEPNFNPINFLAQYLMRNNPKYSNFSEASPYIRSLRGITDELKQQLFDIEENRLAKIKADARRKREERERLEYMREMERQRRVEALHSQFSEWNAGLYSDGRVELALLQNALRSFAEIMEQYPDELRESAKYSKELQSTDDTGRTLMNREFVTFIYDHIAELPSEIFDQFMVHLSRCSLAYRSKAEREQRKTQLTTLFTNCDHTGVGLLDRHRILSLFEMFYDKATDPAKSSLRNPRRWPVVEVDEEDDSLSDSEDEGEKEEPKFFDNNKEVTDQQEGEEKSEEKVDEEETAEEKQEEEEGEKKDEAEKTEEEKTSEPEDKKAEEDATKAEQMLTEGENTVDAEPGETSAATDAAPDVSQESAPVDTTGADQTETTEEQSKLQEPTEEQASASAEKPQIVEEPETETKPAEVQDESAQETTGTGMDEEQEPELSKLADAPQSSLERPPMTQQSKVSFAEGTAFQRERTLLTSQGTRSQSQASAFDENTLNQPQFVQLTETFLGDLPTMETFNKLIIYVREGYVETEEERMQRLKKAREEALMVKRKALLNSLFEMWDNDGSGFLDMDEVETVMKKYKDGMENEAIDAAKDDHKRRSRYHDSRLSKREFREFVYRCGAYMAGEDAFDLFVEYLISSVERSYTERVRGEARKKWLSQIIKVAETSGARLEPVYKCIFQTLYKDAEAHGGGKIISSNIAMLERNDVAPARGDFLLRYVASTMDDAAIILNKNLFRDMRGISFSAVDTGKPIHVPRVKNHGNIHFWNPDRTEEDGDGSFIVVPLKDKKKRVFGLLGVDTLKDPQGRAIFITHEIQFFQGIAKAFSIAYHHIDIRQKTMRISESAISWIHRRCSHVTEIIVYMAEPDQKLQDFVLRKMITTDEKGNAVTVKNPPRLERKDNLFRDYLFKCVDNSESLSADAYGERHLAIPLRDADGRAIVVIDISIGELKTLPKQESREVMKILKLLQMAYKEIAIESKSDEKTDKEGQSALDNGEGENVSVETLFDRLMLMELKENVAKLDAQSYAELKSYKEPPAVIHLIVKAVLGIFNPDKAASGEFENWEYCKKFLGVHLNQKILSMDPTADDNSHIPVEVINGYLDEVPHGEVSKHGSIPAQHLYNWVFVCVSLIEHTRKMQANKQNRLQAEQEAIEKKRLQGEKEKEKKEEAKKKREQKEQQVEVIEEDAPEIETEPQQQQEETTSPPEEQAEN